MTLFTRLMFTPQQAVEMKSLEYLRLKEALKDSLNNTQLCYSANLEEVAKGWWVDLSNTVDVYHHVQLLFGNPHNGFTRPHYTANRSWHWREGSSQDIALDHGGLFLETRSLAHRPGCSVPEMVEFKRVSQWVKEYLDGNLKKWVLE